MSGVQRLVLESALDDWVSDYEVLGDFQAELALERPEAFAEMTPQVTDWIRRGLLVPGDLAEGGFQAWPGGPLDLADRFIERARAVAGLTRPGEICWFDSGPAAASAVDGPDSA